MAFTIDKSHPSPNRSGKLIAYKYLMLHHTASDNFAATVRYLCQPSAKASANYVVGKAGEIAELVPPGTAAWHAGNGSGFGVVSMNRNSIGIEIVNWGNNKDPFPEVQLQALDWLIAHIDKTMGKTVPIIDHKAWAPGRKIDMRANFPLANYKAYRAHVSPVIVHPANEVHVGVNISGVKQRLWRYSTLAGRPLYPLWPSVPAGGEVRILAEGKTWYQVQRGFARGYIGKGLIKRVS